MRFLADSRAVRVLCAGGLLALNLGVVADNAAAQEPSGRLDSLHAQVCRYANAFARWVDSFAGFPAEEREAAAVVRVVPSLELKEASSPTPKVAVGGKLELPGLERRLHLILASFEEEDPERAGEPGQYPPEKQLSLAGLRILLGKIKEWRFSTDFGLRFRPEPDPFVRLRARSFLFQSPSSSVKLTQYLFWSPGKGWGETTRLEAERRFSACWFGRSLTTLTLAEESRGWEGAQTLALWYFASPRRGVGIEGRLEAFTDPDPRVDLGRVDLKFRRRMWRDWIFIEFGPFVEWPLDRDFESTPGFRVQLEALFEK